MPIAAQTIPIQKEADSLIVGSGIFFPARGSRVSRSHHSRRQATKLAASVATKGSRRHAHTALEGTAESIGTLEADAFSNALNGAAQAEKSASRFAQAQFFNKVGWSTVEDLFEEATEMAGAETGSFLPAPRQSCFHADAPRSRPEGR